MEPEIQEVIIPEVGLYALVRHNPCREVNMELNFTQKPANEMHNVLIELLYRYYSGISNLFIYCSELSESQ
jgi:hypothetical protein